MSGPLLPVPMLKKVDLMSVAITAIELAILPEIVALSARIVAPTQDRDLPAVVVGTIADLHHATAETQGVDLLYVEAVVIAGTDTVDHVLLKTQEEAARTVKAGHQGAADRAGAVRRTGVVSRVDN
jgi:hypothetical protein